jgi:Domain of unknown function (DUF4258)
VEAYAYILYRLVLFWGKVPPELVAAGLFAVPGLVGFLAGLPYVLDLVAGGLVSWWVVGIFREHVWPDVPPEHRRLLVALRDLAFLKAPQPRPKESPRRRGCRGPRRLPGMKITYLPHAGLRMRERGISEVEVRAVLGSPDREYPGRLGRTVAERVLPGRRLAIKVVYNRGQEDERIVVTVERGRPTAAPSEGGEA